MTPELSAEERIRILKDRIHHLNRAISEPLESRLEMLQSARVALRKAEREIENDR